MTTISRNIYLFIFLLAPLYILGQHHIQGVIQNEIGEPLIGANVYIKGSFDGASSDDVGHFSFSTSRDTGTVIASFMGFTSFEQFQHFQTDTLQMGIILRGGATELDPVQIQAGSFIAGDAKKGAVLNSIDVVTTAGALADVASALNTLPGTQRVGEEGQLFVRGGAAYETRTFMDGMRIQNPYGSRVPDVPARGRFSPFMFKGMQFSTGGYSAEYGQALSSALIMDTRDLPDQSITGISLMSVGGQLSHTQLWDESSLELNGGYFNLAPYMGLIDQNLDWTHAPESWEGSLAYRKTTSETGMLKAFASFSGSQMRLQYPDLLDAHQSETFGNNNHYQFGQVTFKEVLPSAWLVRGGLAYTRNQDRFILSETTSAEQFLQSAQAKWVASKDVNNKVQLTLGTTTFWEEFDEHYSQPDFEANTLLTEWQTAGFGELNISLNSKWAFRLGTRVEYSKLLEKANVAPRLSLAYKVNDQSQFSFASGIFYQSPEFELLRVNQNLQFEEARHYILNYQWTKGRRIFRVEGYYKAYQDLVTFQSQSEVIWTNFQNEGQGYAQGVDIFYRDNNESINNLDVWFSYSFLDTERRFRDFPTTSTPYFASRHNFSGVGKYFISDLNLQLGLTYSVASSRPFHDPNTEGFNQGRTPTFQDLSANASYLTDIGGNFTIIHLSVSNVLGNEQIFGYRYASQPDANGIYPARVVGPPALRMFFLGLFISID